MRAPSAEHFVFVWRCGGSEECWQFVCDVRVCVCECRCLPCSPSIQHPQHDTKARTKKFHCDSRSLLAQPKAIFERRKRFNFMIPCERSARNLCDFNSALQLHTHFTCRSFWLFLAVAAAVTASPSCGSLPFSEFNASWCAAVETVRHGSCV